jgi:hypothetical protein
MWDPYKFGGTHHINFNQIKDSVLLAQLVGILYVICRNRGSNPDTPTYSL